MSALWTAVALLATAADDPVKLDSEAARTTEKITAAIYHAVRSDDTRPQAAEELVFAPRKPAELRTAVSNALRATATAKDPSARDTAIRKLILILLELEQDKNLMHDERVELRTQVHSRLTALEKTSRAEADRKKSKEKVAAGQGGAKPQAVTDTRPAGDKPLAPAVLAQMINVQQPANGGLGARNGVLGGQNRVIGGQNGAQQDFDYGPDLVNLIQTVIAPRTWDVNGGPGSVIYYRNLRALVISAPSEVHGQIGDALGQLRK
jgi:hypothetical protein